MAAAGESWRLVAAGGIEAVVVPQGATLQQLIARGRDGARSNVAFGSGSAKYFGATIGRYANRIGGGRFTLDGRTYELPRNDRGNCLHGGPHGFDTHPWTRVRGDDASVTLAYVSPDGEMGFPGTLSIELTYAVQGNDLRLDFRASTDAPTVVNVTNHTCWNLAGGGSALGHVLQVDASRYTPVDETGLPGGELAQVAGTRVDFRNAREVADPDLDDNLVLDPAPGLRHAATLADPASGRVVDLLTTQPCVQVWTGGANASPFTAGDFVALETQHAPDSPNRPEFPSTALRPGDVFESTTVFRFGVRL